MRKVALSAQHIKKTSVTGHGDSNGGWAFIASPVADDIAPSVVENLEGVKYQTGTYNYDLYRFDQSADLEWENYHSNDTQENPFMLENGKGYLYASKNDRTLHFSGPFNTDIDSDATLQIVDVTGRVLVSVGGHTRCVPTAGMTSGVYVLRLIDGDNVRTQKIIIT